MYNRLPFLLLAAVPWLGGCLTIGVWTDAGPDQMQRPYVAGHVGAAATAAGQPARPTALVVRYDLPYTFRPRVPPPLWVAVPLDASGEPAAPFAYHGTAKTPAEVVGDLKPEQVAAARAATARLNFGGAPSPKTWPGFREPDEPRRDHSWQTTSSGITVFAYRITPTGTVSPVYDDEPWTADVHVAILPVEAARPPGDKANAALRAVLLAPVTIGLDVLTLPLAIVVIFTGGSC